VTEHPTDKWITQQLRDATPFEEKPKYLICDNDKKYGPVFERVAKASGIGVIHMSSGESKAGRLIAFPVLNGLHHDYRWAAA
jgi:hypothetical protein